MGGLQMRRVMKMATAIAMGLTVVSGARASVLGRNIRDLRHEWEAAQAAAAIGRPEVAALFPKSGSEEEIAQRLAAVEAAAQDKVDVEALASYNGPQRRFEEIRRENEMRRKWENSHSALIERGRRAELKQRREVRRQRQRTRAGQQGLVANQQSSGPKGPAKAFIPVRKGGRYVFEAV